MKQYKLSEIYDRAIKLFKSHAWSQRAYIKYRPDGKNPATA